jgi:hypothetical protein
VLMWLFDRECRLYVGEISLVAERNVHNPYHMTLRCCWQESKASVIFCTKHRALLTVTRKGKGQIAGHPIRIAHCLNLVKVNNHSLEHTFASLWNTSNCHIQVLLVYTKLSRGASSSLHFFHVFLYNYLRNNPCEAVPIK